MDDVLARLEQRLPAAPDDPRILSDAADKVERLRRWLATADFDSVLISRRDLFAWLTVGGDSHVLKNTEFGVGHLLVTRSHQYVLAYTMDGPRLMAEQVRGQGYELVTLPWHAGDPRDLAAKLGGARIASDSAWPGTCDTAVELSRLQEPLTALELDRLRWLGRQTGLVFEAAAPGLEPGMTEHDIAALLTRLFMERHIDLDVLLVGTDARAEQFRHVIPTGRRFEHYVLMNPASRRWGLHANVSRAVHIGPVPDRLRRAYDDAAAILSEVLVLIEPGKPFAAVRDTLRAAFARRGYEDGWRAHFPGGVTGYVVADDRTGAPLPMVTGQAHDFFVTLPGVMIEELTLLGDSGLELPSLGPLWPTRLFGSIDLPDLWVRP
jgi:Xaa-Pro aminopeptidase